MPSWPPQSDSPLHGPKRFVGAFVWQSFGPATLSIWYVPAIPWPSATSGSHVAFVAGVHTVGFTPHGAVVVVVADVVVVVGHASPDARGMQTSVRTSRSVCLGFAADEARAESLHRFVLVPCRFSLTTIPEAGPQVAFAPPGEKPSAAAPWQLPATLTRVGVALVHDAPVQTPRSNVQEPFAVATPSASQVGSQSRHVHVPPLARSSGTPENATRHSFAAAIAPCTSTATDATRTRTAAAIRGSRSPACRGRPASAAGSSRRW